MNEELKTLTDLGVFTIINEIPKGRKPLGCKWVFKIKRTGTYKARLTVKGYNQIYGLDFDETFSPVARLVNTRMILSIGTSKDYFFKSFDVKSAFPNAELDEEIYMIAPTEMNLKPGQYVRLNKALYGLKQASRAWYKKLTSILVSHGYRQSKLDTCVMLKETPEGMSLISIYVDDILAASPTLQPIEQLCQILENNFQIHESELSDYLGLNIEYDRNKHNLTFDNNAYCTKLLEKYEDQWKGTRKRNVPMQPLTKFEKRNSEMEKSATTDMNLPFREICGGLLYLANASRPDILFAVNKCCQFMSDPNMTHWSYLMDIMSYLNDHRNFKITYSKNSTLPTNTIVCFVDADHANCLVTRRSTTGFLLFMNGGLICWSVRLQISASGGGPTESEYKALFSAASEVRAARHFLIEIGIQQNSPTVIYEDNKGVIDFTKGRLQHSNLRHVDTKYHSIMDWIKDKDIHIEWTTSENQLADIMTKALGPAMFIKIVGLILSVFLHGTVGDIKSLFCITQNSSYDEKD
jgi:hypothetical protein